MTPFPEHTRGHRHDLEQLIPAQHIITVWTLTNNINNNLIIIISSYKWSLLHPSISAYSVIAPNRKPQITTITSTTSYKLINYKDLYFNHSSFRNITGNPTYDDLQDFYKQVKANAASVPSNLEGSLQGQLGIVTDATNYARISNTSYV